MTQPPIYFFKKTFYFFISLLLFVRCLRILRRLHGACDGILGVGAAHERLAAVATNRHKWRRLLQRAKGRGGLLRQPRRHYYRELPAKAERVAVSLARVDGVRGA